MYRLFFKRILDFFASLSGLLVLSPFLVVLVVLLFFTNKGKPFFLQSRPGKNGKLFNIIKFKTMLDLDPNKEEDVHSPNRITKVGAFIRKYSLDEILQLVNVLKGDMSLIGPRPLLIEYLPLYNEEQQMRHNVRPGITGWAQINGRNSISWAKKFELDVWYVNNLNFILDIKILFLTVKKIIVKEGVNSGQDIIMPVFNGNN